MMQGLTSAREALARRQILAVAHTVMKTINLPGGNAFGVDNDDGGTPYVNYAEQRAKTLFFVWVSLTEHRWVILGERRGSRFH